MLALLALAAAQGRQTIDLDGGWEFVRLPNPPSVWNGPDAVSTASWRVESVSSEETKGEDAPARKAFDGRPDTFWHTEWQARQASYPHRLRIDLGAPTDVVGLRILPRQTGPQNGRPHHFEMTLDGASVSGTIPDSGNLYEQRFPQIRGRTLTLTFTDGYRPEPFLALAEIGLIRPTVKGSDWASQYDIANVTTGDARFDPTPADLERIRKAETKNLKGWQAATLPHAAWVRPLDSSEIWQGVTYYRRRLPAIPKGRRAMLELQGIHRVDAWLNGRPVGHRLGGYLPMRAELHEGGELLVRVDNTDNPLIPPGKPQGQLDFMYGAGLIGHASLTLTDPLRITDSLEGDGGVRVEAPDLRKGTTWAHTVVRNDGVKPRRFVLRQSLFDPSGRSVLTNRIDQLLKPGQQERIAQFLKIPKPQLWTTDSPKLYRLVSSIVESGRVVDEVTTKIGLRTVEVSREKGLLLNGKPLRLVGTNRHQDYPWVGPALSDAAQWRDAMLIKRSGHNIVRLSHYNQSPAFMDACDVLGILTIPCIPGWQFINNDPRFKERTLRDIRESVWRDRNHASVAWWESSLNETYPPATLAKSWYDTAHAAGAAIVAGDESAGAPWDVIYNGWKEDLSRPQNTPKPGYIREYGDYEFGGGTSTSRVRIGQGTDKLLEETWNHVWSYNKFRPQYPATMGAGTWEMFDHNVPWAFAVSASGLADLMRREKPSFWFYASQEAKKPYLKLARTQNPLSPLGERGQGVRGKSLSNSPSDRLAAVPESDSRAASQNTVAPHPQPLSPREERGAGAGAGGVVVFTNASSVTLFLNGKPLRIAKVASGPETRYNLDRRFDGTNTANLPHPPIVFRDIPKGEIKVVGSNGATDSLHRPGKPVRLKVWVDDLGVAPTRNDRIFVRAAVVDAKGNVVIEKTPNIRFGGADFAGQNTSPTEMGIASVLVRTPMKGGKLVVRATLGKLKGEVSLVVR